MSAMERIECPGCKGMTAVWPTAECPVCNGIGTVLKKSDQLGASEREDMEGKLKKLREGNEALLAENLKLQRKCQEQEANLDRLKGRLEMVYLIFGAEGEAYCL